MPTKTDGRRRFLSEAAHLRLYMSYFAFMLVMAILAGARLPASAESAAGEHMPPAGFSDLLNHLETRARDVEQQASELEELHDYDIAPLVQVLTARGAEPAWATRLVMAFVREGRAVRIDPRLLLSIMLVEDPKLDSAAVSPVGALGLMQVMPFHLGEWDCPEGDLRVPEVNICHGAKILEYNLKRSSGNLDVALLRYNGCVRGTFTADCHLYPMRVFRMAALGWLGDEDAPVYSDRRLSRSLPIE